MVGWLRSEAPNVWAAKFDRAEISNSKMGRRVEEDSSDRRSTSSSSRGGENYGIQSRIIRGETSRSARGNFSSNENRDLRSTSLNLNNTDHVENWIATGENLGHINSIVENMVSNIACLNNRADSIDEVGDSMNNQNVDLGCGAEVGLQSHTSSLPIQASEGLCNIGLVNVPIMAFSSQKKRAPLLRSVCLVRKS